MRLVSRCAAAQQNPYDLLPSAVHLRASVRSDALGGIFEPGAALPTGGAAKAGADCVAVVRKLSVADDDWRGPALNADLASACSAYDGKVRAVVGGVVKPLKPDAMALRGLSAASAAGEIAPRGSPVGFAPPWLQERKL